MSCSRCLSFDAPYCAEWGQEVPESHRCDGCGKILPDDDPRSFESAFRRAQTTRDLWRLSYKWKAGEVSDSLWDLLLSREKEIGGPPLSFWFRRARVHKWCLGTLCFSPSGARKIRIEDVSEACFMAPEQAEECLADLYKEGVLKMEKTKKESLFWMKAP